MGQALESRSWCRVPSCRSRVASVLIEGNSTDIQLVCFGTAQPVVRTLLCQLVRSISKCNKQ